MRFAAGLVLVLSVAACSKHEPPPAVAAAPAKPATAPAQVATPPPAPAVPAGGSLSPDQGASSAHAAPPTSAPAPAPVPAVAAAPDGAAIFNQTCATCHMADGSGVPYLQPSIRGSAWISNPDPQLLLSLILRGSAVLGEAAKAYENDMAPQDHLSDAEVAAVATYVRGRFGTPPVTKPVTAAEVAVARARPGLPQ